MNNKNSCSFQYLIQSFFQQRLMQHKKVSGQTINSYRDTFKIYFEFLIGEYNIQPSAINLEHLDREHILEFCKYLETRRKNCSSTINNRLSAIHSFLKYVSEMSPDNSYLVSQSLAIPFQKTTIKTMDFITKDEFDSIILLCDTNTMLGARDKLMFLILYNTGLRVSELISLKYCDINDLDIPNRTCLKIYGKGRKERIVPLWKTTSQYLSKYIDRFGIKDNDYLLIGKNGEKLTRSGVRFKVEKYVKEAGNTCNSLKNKNISVHTFRHSVAMNLLQAGVDISTIAIWLGHSSILTTHKYMVADIELKRKAMERVNTSSDSTMNYQPSDDILEFLKNL